MKTIVPSEAPPEIPMTSGDVSGLRTMPCSSAPETASAEPTSIAITTRGSRSETTIIACDGSPPPRSERTTSIGLIVVLPRPAQTIKATIFAAASSRIATSVLRWNWKECLRPLDINQLLMLAALPSSGDVDEERHADDRRHDADRHFLGKRDEARADIRGEQQNAAEHGTVRNDPTMIDADQVTRDMRDDNPDERDRAGDGDGAPASRTTAMPAATFT